MASVQPSQLSPLQKDILINLNRRPELSKNVQKIFDDNTSVSAADSQFNGPSLRAKVAPHLENPEGQLRKAKIMVIAGKILFVLSFFVEAALVVVVTLSTLGNPLAMGLVLLGVIALVFVLAMSSLALSGYGREKQFELDFYRELEKFLNGQDVDLYKSFDPELPKKQNIFVLCDCFTKLRDALLKAYYEELPGRIAAITEEGLVATQIQNIMNTVAADVADKYLP